MVDNPALKEQIKQKKQQKKKKQQEGNKRYDGYEEIEKGILDKGCKSVEESLNQRNDIIASMN